MFWTGMAIATMIAAGIGLIGSIGTNISNKKSVEDTNRTNKDINDANLAYNKEVQETTWQREDSAWQRGVADAEAAGLSPLAVTAGSSSGSTVGAPSAIPMQAFQGANVTESVISTLMQGMSLDQDERQFNAKLEQEDNHFKTTIQEQYDAMQADIDKLNIQLASAESEAQKDRILQDKQFRMQLLQQLKIANQAYTLDKKKFDAEMATADFHEQQNLVKQRIVEALGDGAEKYAFKPMDGSYDEFTAALRAWNSRNSDFEQDLELKYPYSSETRKDSASTSSNSGTSGSVGSNLGVPIAGVKSDLNSSESSTDSSDFSNEYFHDYEKARDRARREHYRDDPYPIWFGDVEFQGSSGTYRGYYGKKAS